MAIKAALKKIISHVRHKIYSKKSGRNQSVEAHTYRIAIQIHRRLLPNLIQFCKQINGCFLRLWILLYDICIIKGKQSC